MGGPERMEVNGPGMPPPASPSPGNDRQEGVVLSPSVVPEKSCGSCTKCCTIMGVPELKKRPWEECPHVAPGLGCGIYSERPSGCRKFVCGWLLDPQMGPNLKPEKCHVIFYQMNEQHIVATCDPNYPDAWRAPDVSEFLYRLASSTGPNRRVILSEKGRTWFVTENGIVPTDTG
jgi:hypothetical protein